MEVSRLSADLKYVEINGVTLNVEERSRIDLACQELAASIGQGQIFFWGKIRGKSHPSWIPRPEREETPSETARAPALGASRGALVSVSNI